MMTALRVRKLSARRRVRDILFNWFHGGTTFNTVHRYLFIANLVVSRSRVGPLRVS
jgi:hypothetical protein